MKPEICQWKNYIKDVKSSYWKNKIINSINNIVSLYSINSQEIRLQRKSVNPREILVAAQEECDLKTAEYLSKTKYAHKLPAPITLIEYKDKRVIFIGSNRSLVFMLKGKKPDCLIVILPSNIKKPEIFSFANETLAELIKQQEKLNEER